jgi:mono/diheme cytochrome c family protein
MRRRAAAMAALMFAFMVGLGGCERALHEMYDQPKYQPLTPSPLFADGNSARPQVTGTVPHSAGALAATSSGRAEPLEETRASPVTLLVLARGRERFDIYCTPCHGRAGYGDGMIARRGFPGPPSFHTTRLRAASDSHFYQVMSEGYGVMYPYADRITAADRWAIVAYIRALQLSQDAPAASLEAQDLTALKARVR